MKTCSVFWKHINIRGDNRIVPCCRFKKPVATYTGDLDHLLTSKTFQDLRNTDVSTMPECAKCMYEEDNGITSFRQKFNQQLDTATVGLEYLEIGFDNICNLTCDGCYPEFSSAWSKKLNPHAHKSTHYTSINEITAIPDTVNKIMFLGGEPLMTSRHKKVLEMIADPSKVKISYNTNATFLLDNDLINILKQFKHVHFIVSIDGYKELNEKVRTGTKWSDVEAFIKQIQENGFEMSVNSVIHLNNWQGMPDLERFVETLDLTAPHYGTGLAPWYVNILTYPLHLDIRNAKNKQEIVDVIAKTDIPNKEYVLNHLS